MGIVVKQFNGSSVTPKDDALMYELIFQNYGIFNGCGISFLGVNKIMINSGRMIVKGRQVVITEETIEAQLSSGGTKRGRLYIRLDLSSPDNPASFLTQVADELPALTQQDDLNYNDGIFEIELCNYDVSETAISNIVESCPMITGSVDLLKSVEELLANTEEGKAVDALIIKQLYNSLTEQPQFVYDENGQITGYTTKIGGADTVFPFILFDIKYGGKLTTSTSNGLSTINFPEKCSIILAISGNSDSVGIIAWYDINSGKAYRAHTSDTKITEYEVGARESSMSFFNNTETSIKIKHYATLPITWLYL